MSIVEQKPQWVSVGSYDQLPHFKQRLDTPISTTDPVLVRLDNDVLTVGYCVKIVYSDPKLIEYYWRISVGENGSLDYLSDDVNVTHWMPIPKLEEEPPCP